MNIVQKLSLNKHPKDVQDLSLVLAQNVKVSKDMSCITNEEGIRKNTYIKSFLENYYKKDYKVLGVIPCNNELVIITSAVNNISVASIFRYREDTSLTKESMKCVYDRLIYNGGKYTGTFTYNVEESLILALSEYDALINVPLKVINLGNFDDNNIENDLHLTDNQLSLVPEVKLPNFDYSIIEGNAYKGWYFVFIRYKINTVDYTQWYNFGTPIYIDHFKKQTITNEVFYYILGEHYLTRIPYSNYINDDSFSTDDEVVNTSFNLKLNNIDNTYSNYQLGFICCTKSYTKSFRTNDILKDVINYKLNISALIEESIVELVNPYYNYFNVKNITNYKNRLYISNYTESFINNINDEELIELSKNVNLTLYKQEHKVLRNGNNIDSKFPNDRTLIPNGVYNFYVHFVDKWGHATKGYKLDPEPSILNSGIDGLTTYIPIEYAGEKYYYIVPSDKKMSELIAYAGSITPVITKTFRGGNATPIATIGSEEVVSSLRLQYNEFLNLDVYVSQIFNNALDFTVNVENGDTIYKFGNVINANGNKLWRVPDIRSAVEITHLEEENIHVNTFYKFYITCELNEDLLKPYVGYYISQEEYESVEGITGYLTKRNANTPSNEKISNNNLLETEDYVLEKNRNNICFYSSYFDISDKLNLSYNAIRLNYINREKPFNSKIIPIFDESASGTNEIFIAKEALFKLYYLKSYHLAIANDDTYDRLGLGTCLLIDDENLSFGLFENNSEETVTTYLATLFNYTNDIYINKIKKLIRISDVIYDKHSHIINGLNGFLNFDGVLIYNDNGYNININSNTNVYKSATLKNGTNYYLPDGHDYQNNVPNPIMGVKYVITFMYSNICSNSKIFNNRPKIAYNFIEDPSNENAAKLPTHIVEPINSIDLFKNPQGSVDNFYPITSTNYIEEDLNVIQFDKTIRRSNVIQDETRLNAWRQFPIEGYKNITENKGKITKLIGIGYMFLVHTEHSLFIFDTNNLLQAVNTDVQLVQPDAFEVNYKEVFTSDLGFGGLQDNKAGIVDTFGYIFYNNDANRFYHFDNGQLAVIDNDIIEWLYKVKPYNVRFANDKINNRLLIKMSTDSISVEQGAPAETFVLSYNYNLKSFISFHTYTFDEAYNTKNDLYLRCDDHNNCSLHQFKELHNDKYGSFDNVRNSLGTVINQQSKIGIIVNPSFDVIKYLEYFSYKLSKIKDASELDLVYSPVKEFIEPFSGNLLKVYNNLTNTGELDISVNEEISKNIYAHFDKPYWHLGNWNYNYLRNNINEANRISSDYLSRIVGNYFIIEFTFNNDDNKLIEFEGLTYKVSQ